MTTATVTNVCKDALGNPVVGATVTAWLNTPAFDTAGQFEITGAGTTKTDATGAYSLTLPLNSEQTPANTYYTVSEPGGVHWTIQLSSAGTFWINSVLVTPPAQAASAIGSLRYDVAQSLTAAQQAQAQANAGFVGGSGAGGSASIPSLLTGVASGQFMRIPQLSISQSGGTVATLNRLHAVQFHLTAQTTVVKMGFYLWGNGTTGAVVRLGIYGDSAGYPGSLLVDAGTVSATTGASGHITITLGTPLALSPGSYYAAIVAQGAPTTAPTIVTETPLAAQVNTANAPNALSGWYLASVTGALPSTFTAGGTALTDSTTGGGVVPMAVTIGA